MSTPVHGRNAKNDAKSVKKKTFNAVNRLNRDVDPISSTRRCTTTGTSTTSTRCARTCGILCGFLFNLHCESLSLLSNCTQHSVDEPNLRHNAHEPERLLELSLHDHKDVTNNHKNLHGLWHSLRVYDLEQPGRTTTLSMN